MLSINEDKSHTGTDFDDPGIYIWIRTYHPDCEGIWDPEQNQIDENVFCPVQWAAFCLGSLTDLTYDVLDIMILETIEQSGDHGEAQTDLDPFYLTFNYVYDDEDMETELLNGQSDIQLRSIVARGSGFVIVEWE